MTTSIAQRLIAAVASSTLLCATLLAPAAANASGTQSQGHGVKCSWALQSTINGVNTYVWVCRRGV
jgi:hypothetical protein